jgi:hypothetical protein
MIDGMDRAERLARIEELIDEYRIRKRDRIVRRAMRLWRTAAARQRLVTFDAKPEQVH